jgi:hypothetical protein
MYFALAWIKKNLDFWNIDEMDELYTNKKLSFKFSRKEPAEIKDTKEKPTPKNPNKKI